MLETAGMAGIMLLRDIYIYIYMYSVSCIIYIYMCNVFLLGKASDMCGDESIIPP